MAGSTERRAVGPIERELERERARTRADFAVLLDKIAMVRAALAAEVDDCVHQACLVEAARDRVMLRRLRWHTLVWEELVEVLDARKAQLEAMMPPPAPVGAPPPELTLALARSYGRPRGAA